MSSHIRVNVSFCFLATFIYCANLYCIIENDLDTSPYLSSLLSHFGACRDNISVLDCHTSSPYKPTLTWFTERLCGVMEGAILFPD